MAIQTSAGTTLGIVSGLPATYDAAGFGALTFATVGEMQSLTQTAKSITSLA